MAAPKRQSYVEVAVGEHTYGETIYFTEELQSVRVYAWDVTERKRAEDALKLTQLSVDRAADLIHWIGPDGRLLYVSDTCWSHGYSRDEMLAMTLFDLDPSLSREQWSELGRLKEQGSLEFETVHRPGTGALSRRRHANYVRYEDKEYNCVFARDITERKHMEDALRRTQFAVDHLRISSTGSVPRAGSSTSTTPVVVASATPGKSCSV